MRRQHIANVQQLVGASTPGRLQQLGSVDVSNTPFRHRQLQLPGLVGIDHRHQHLADGNRPLEQRFFNFPLHHHGAINWAGDHQVLFFLLDYHQLGPQGGQAFAQL